MANLGSEISRPFVTIIAGVCQSRYSGIICMEPPFGYELFEIDRTVEVTHLYYVDCFD